ncbi:MAG: hypothetical protein IT423_13120 [Pirellulaceae bacterium]|nr:hypothetical protein [Pirellulaceae bacterium]
MRIRVALLAVASSTCLHQIALAHPGHAVEGSDSHGLVHYLVHPDHLAQWLVALCIMAISLTIVRSVRRLAPAYARARKRV